MTKYTTKTRMFGTLRFSIIAGKVFVAIEDGLMAQIERGGLLASTGGVKARDDTLKKVAQNWIRARRRRVRKDQEELAT